MGATVNPIRLELNELLSDGGYLRSKDTWRRRSPEVVEVVNIQKSQYGHQYYLNYGIWILAVGENKAPRDEDCHIQIRITSAISSGKELAMLLDLEREMSDGERREGIRRLFLSEFFPWSSGCASIAGLKAMFGSGEFRAAGVRGPAIAILGHPVRSGP